MPLSGETPGSAPPVTIRRRLQSKLGLLLPGFDEIREHRPVAAPLVLVSVLSVTAAFSIQPFVSGFLPGEVSRGLAAVLWIAAIFSPVLAGGKALLLAVLSWSGLVLVGRDVRLRLLASLFLYGEAILALHGVAMVSVLHLRGPEAVSTIEDLYVPMGLEGFVPAGAPVLEALARGGTAFHLTWFLFLAVALVRVAGLSPRVASVVAGGAWALALSLAAIRAVAFP